MGIISNNLSIAIADHNWKLAHNLILTTPSLARSWSVSQSFAGTNKVADVLPIHFACAVEDVPYDFLEALVFAYPEGLEKPESGSGRIPLHLAMRAQVSKTILEFLIQRHPYGLRTPDRAGRLPIHYACSNNVSDQVVQALLQECPESIRCPDKLGWTPLLVAANTGASLQLVKRLVHQDPKTLTMTTYRGTSPVMAALSSGGTEKDDIISFLKEEEMKIDKLTFFRNYEDALNKSWNNTESPASSFGRFYGVKKQIGIATSCHLVV
jgi:hypothetical protein